MTFNVCICTNFQNKFGLQEDVNKRDEIINLKGQLIEGKNKIIEQKHKLMRLIERTIDDTEKTIEIMNDTSRKNYRKRLRLDEDIKKLKRIIIMKDKTIETKNIIIEELKHKKKIS